jgi:ComF family protein
VLIDLIGDLLSPPRCASCDSLVARRLAFCAACAASVERSGTLNSAGRERERAVFADGAPRDDDVDRATAIAFGYYGGALAQAIRRFKYEDRPDLARPLGQLLRGACRDAAVRADAVLPVPLHARRLVTRGYNQAALLAAHVAAEIDAPLLTSTLVRAVDTASQVEQSSGGRQSNVEGAFAVTNAAWVEGRTLALVDDVTTTGATLAACRRTLLSAGARRVIHVVVARTAPTQQTFPLGLDSEPPLNLGHLGTCASSRCADVSLRANLRN